MKIRNVIFKVAAVLFAAGAVIWFAAFAASGFDISKTLRSEKFEQKVAEIDSFLYSKVEIDTENIQVIIKPSEDAAAKIDYPESKNFPFVFSDNDDVYSITIKDIRKWYERLFNFSLTPLVLTVYLPADYAGEMDIQTSNAQITTESINFSSLNLVTSNSSISISDSKVGSLSAVTSNGKITATNIEAQTADFYTSNSQIVLSQSGFSTVEAKTSNGKITTEDVEAQTAGFYTSNGEIRLDSCDYDSVTAKTDNASIVFFELMGEEIRLETSNGSINGSVFGTMGEYKIKSQTSNASNNLPADKTDGSKELNVKTSNGKIDFLFLG